MRLVPRLLLAIAAAMATLAGAARAENCAFGGRADIPLEDRDGALLIDGVAAGHPVKLRLATGAVATTLWSRTASRLGLHTERSGIAINAGRSNPSGVATGSHVAAPRSSRLLLTDPVALDLGALHFTGVKLGVADFQPERMEGADGLLGLDLLSRYDVDFDIAHGRITAYQASEGCREPASPLEGQFVSVPFTKRGVFNHQPEFEASSGGKVFRARLSSVGKLTLIRPSVAISLGLAASEDALAPGTVVTLPELSIGGLTLRNAAAEITDEPDMADVTFRLAFMRKVRVWLSNSSGHLILGLPTG